jgi:uncharacterized membrane protein YkgB
MFKEWLERMAIGFLFILVMIVILLTLALFGTLWYLIYEASKLLGISILIVVLGVPLITFIYTVYDNWSYVCSCFEEKMEKWGKKDV